MTHAELGYKGTKSMEVKNGKPANGSTDSAMSAKKAVDFVGGIKGEIQRVTWTSWDELKVYTQIVVAATFIFGMGLYFTDLIIQTVLHGLSAIIKLIGG